MMSEKSSNDQKKDEPEKSFEAKNTAQKENREKADMTGAERFEASLGSSYRINADDITKKSTKEPSEPSDNLE